MRGCIRALKRRRNHFEGLFLFYVHEILFYFGFVLSEFLYAYHLKFQGQRKELIPGPGAADG